MFGSVRRLTVVAGSVAALAVGGLVATPSAFAYGHADGPVAQVEVSANCDNPSVPLCSPQAVGLGGIWYWAELDTGGTGDMSGAVCGRTGGSGAISIKGEDSWVQTSLENAPQGAIFFGTLDPNDQYYAITITIGETWLVPVTTGHYSVRMAPGVQIQITVAP